jgi:hypothetical protein
MWLPKVDITDLTNREAVKFDWNAWVTNLKAAQSGSSWFAVACIPCDTKDGYERRGESMPVAVLELTPTPQSCQHDE